MTKTEKQNLSPKRTLESNTVRHADGTFKAFPALLNQIFTIHAMNNDQTIPLIFFLLQNKNEEQ